MPRGKRKTALNVTATNIGTTLGHLAARVDNWNKQRQELVDEIHGVTSRLLSDLGQASVAVRKGVKAVQAEEKALVKKAKRKVSPAARAKLAASMKARWAAVKKAGKKQLG